jgi:hypothetical protein
MHHSRDKLGIFLPIFYNQSEIPIGSERQEQEWSPELIITEESLEQISMKKVLKNLGIGKLLHFHIFPYSLWLMKE